MKPERTHRKHRRELLHALAAGLLCLLASGCYAPMNSPGIEARRLPEQFRWPLRTSAAPLNYSHLVAQAPTTYLLGPGDKLQLTAPDLIAQGHSEPIALQVLDQGEIHLPRLGAVAVEGLSLATAQQKINTALADHGLLNKPSTVLTLVEKGTVNVLVLGAVKTPGVHALPRFENDVAHALAAAQGFSEEAGEVIEIHRRSQTAGCDLCNTQPLHQATPVTPLHLPPTQIFGTHGSIAPDVRDKTSTLHPRTEFPSADHVAIEQMMTPAVPGQSRQPVLSLHSGHGHHFNGVPVGGIIRPPAPLSATPVPLQLPGHSTQQPPPVPQTPIDFGNPDRGRQQNSAAETIFRGQSPVPVIEDCGELCAGPLASPIIRIPLRGDTSGIDPRDMVLNPGDVLVIPRKTDKVFYVVGPLSEQNRLRFSVGDKDRQIGNGLLLPENREVDVVTAVAMAGYIDPIESPTTVTVHRVMPDRRPLLIRVDLIAARSDSKETVMIQPGDIIYLNPDPWWYSRRTMDRVIERALGTAVGRWLTN